MPFLSKVKVEEHGTQEFLLLAPLRYQCPRTHRLFTVPVGFVTDFASIPKPLTALIARWGRHGPGAVLHDYLYEVGHVLGLDRKTCDLIFLDAMRSKGTPIWKAYPIYYGVRIGGGRRWWVCKVKVGRRG